MGLGFDNNGCIMVDKNFVGDRSKQLEFNKTRSPLTKTCF